MATKTYHFSKMTTPEIREAKAELDAALLVAETGKERGRIKQQYNKCWTTISGRYRAEAHNRAVAEMGERPAGTGEDWVAWGARFGEILKSLTDADVDA